MTSVNSENVTDVIDILKTVGMTDTSDTSKVSNTSDGTSAKGTFADVPSDKKDCSLNDVRCLFNKNKQPDEYTIDDIKWLFEKPIVECPDCTANSKCFNHKVKHVKSIMKTIKHHNQVQIKIFNSVIKEIIWESAIIDFIQEYARFSYADYVEDE